MSSNDRYRGNREYRDLTVQTHYGKSGRSPRVQTKHPFDADMKFSQDSADFRRPYEDREFVDRSRANMAGQQQRRQQPRQPQPQQQPLPYQVDSRQYYDRQIQRNQGQRPSQPQPQHYQQPYQPQQASRQAAAAPAPAPAPRKAVKQDANDMRRMKSDYVVDNETIALNMKPKVGKEQVLQIDMIFKICIMVWAAVALVTVIVLLT